MARDFSLKELEKIAKEQIRAEKTDELTVANNIIDEYEDDIIKEINEIIIECLKRNETFTEINVCNLRCLKNKGNFKKDIYYFVKLHICRLYKEKGFPIDTGTFNRYSFYIFRSKYAKWRNKLSLFV